MPDYQSQEEAIKHHTDGYRSDGDASGYFEATNHHYNRVQYIINKVPEGSYVLDAGCNSGGLSRRLMSLKGCFVKGVDIIPELVSRAIMKGVYAQTGKVEALPYPDNEFDVVVCSEVLEHLYDPEVALKEIKRVLRPDGIFIGSVPHKRSTNEAKSEENERLKQRYHKYIFTLPTIKKLLKKYFKIEDIQNIPYFKYYCVALGIPEDKPQWIGWTCVK